MSRSYQEMDVRLEGVETALMFVMQTIHVNEKETLFDIYRKALAAGAANVRPDAK